MCIRDRYSTAINIKDKALSKAVHNVDVYDREGDIYDVFCGVPDEKTDLVIRSKANRKVVSDSGKKTTLERALSCLLYTSPSPRDRTRSRMPSSA